MDPLGRIFATWTPTVMARRTVRPAETPYFCYCRVPSPARSPRAAAMSSLTASSPMSDTIMTSTGEELGDPCCRWRAGMEVDTSDAEISHPGFASSFLLNPVLASSCEDTDPHPEPRCAAHVYITHLYVDCCGPPGHACYMTRHYRRSCRQLPCMACFCLATAGYCSPHATQGTPPSTPITALSSLFELDQP